MTSWSVPIWSSPESQKDTFSPRRICWALKWLTGKISQAPSSWHSYPRSTVQDAEHPSRDSELPSSHSSLPERTPSPQKVCYMIWKNEWEIYKNILKYDFNILKLEDPFWISKCQIVSTFFIELQTGIIKKKISQLHNSSNIMSILEFLAHRFRLATIWQSETLCIIIVFAVDRSISSQPLVMTPAGLMAHLIL